MAKLLVTGGAGFIGSHIVDKLIERKHHVVVLDDLSNGKIENVNKKSKFVKMSVNDNLNNLFSTEKFDYVFHLAAQMNLRKSLENPMDDAKRNCLGSLNVIENCYKNKIKRIIFSSTGGAIYSMDAELPCNEESVVQPESPYGLAKFTVENYLRIMKKVYGLNYTALRYANVYGPRQNAKGEAGVISIFISKLLEGKRPVIFGDGEQTRDFVFVEDVVRANLLALDSNLEGIFNVSSEVEASVNEVYEIIKDSLGIELEPEYGAEVKGELRRSVLDSSKLKSRGWISKVGLEDGLKQTVEWFRKNCNN